MSVAGPVLGAEFSTQNRNTPSVYHCVYVIRIMMSSIWSELIKRGITPPRKLCVTCEAQSLNSISKVQLMSLQPSLGLALGMAAVTHHLPLCVPVGKIVLGRMVNVFGNPIDRLGPLWRFMIDPKVGISMCVETQSGKLTQGPLDNVYINESIR